MNKYRTFVRRGCIIFLLAVVTIVTVFLLVQLLLYATAQVKNVSLLPANQPVSSAATERDILAEPRSSTETTTADEAIDSSAKTSVVDTAAGIYLRDLPLSDGQQSLAATFGIDVETYYLTPETIACAENTLGAARFEVVLGGTTPTFTEATKLLGCLQ